MFPLVLQTFQKSTTDTRTDFNNTGVQIFVLRRSTGLLLTGDVFSVRGLRSTVRPTVRSHLNVWVQDPSRREEVRGKNPFSGTLTLLTHLCLPTQSPPPLSLWSVGVLSSLLLSWILPLTSPPLLLSEWDFILLTQSLDNGVLFTEVAIVESCCLDTTERVKDTRSLDPHRVDTPSRVSESTPTSVRK